MKVNFLDLFSGIGGFTLGFKNAGFEIVNHLFSEVDKYAIEVYQQNFKKAVHCGSITTICGEELRKKYDNGYPWIVTFGFPCQDISIAGRRKGFRGQRSSLFFAAMDVVEQLQPSYFIAENVKGLYSSCGGFDFKTVLQKFADCGYNAQWQLLNTRWVLPQNRERIYFVGYPATRTRNRPKILFERESNKIYNSTSTANKKIHENSLCLTARGQANLTGSFIKVGTWRTHKDGQGFREVEDGICPTIPARGREDGSGQGVIAIKNKFRRLTPIECERLQGFPDNWTKWGINGKIISDSQRYKMCGNAVTVPIVTMIAKKIKQAMEGVGNG